MVYVDTLYFVFSIQALTFGLLGNIFLIIYGFRARKLRSWDTAEGIIIKKEKHMTLSLGRFMNKQLDRENMPDQAPTVSYQVDGVHYESTSNIRQQPGLKPGKRVQVFYNPEAPEKAVINTFVQKGALFKLIGWIFISIALILLIVLAVLWYMH